MTHSVPTIAGNVVSMVAAGNAIVFNPLPGGAKCAALHQRVIFHPDGSATRELVGDERSPLRNLFCAVVDPVPAPGAARP